MVGMNDGMHDMDGSGMAHDMHMDGDGEMGAHDNMMHDMDHGSMGMHGMHNMTDMHMMMMVSPLYSYISFDLVYETARK